MALRLDAYQAVAERKITLKAEPTDSFQKIRVAVTNNTDSDLDLDVSSTGFIPLGDSDAQRIGLSHVAGEDRGTYVVTVPARAKVTVEFSSRCLDYHRPAPPNGLSYTVMLSPLPHLIAEMLRRAVGQQDMWTDIEGTPALKQQWESLDPRDCTLKAGSIPISTVAPLAGEWYSPEWNYAFRLIGDRGIMTVSNTPAFPVGAECFRISWLEGNRLRGEHGFTDGSWHPVEGEFTSDKQMHLCGGGHDWVLLKR